MTGMDPIDEAEPRAQAPAISQNRVRIGRDGAQTGARDLPEETPVALVYNGSTQAVMMATPLDLEDFGVGFSLTEGLIHAPSDISDLDVVWTGPGAEVRMWLARDRAEALAARRRHMAGPTGCGLCGIESLTEATRLPPPPAQSIDRIPLSDVEAALTALEPLQALGRRTRAVHAAGQWVAGAGFVHLREDVGRHNALDKLVGAAARDGRLGAGFVVLTSRVSVEMVQKAAAGGYRAVVAVSAPTALAVRTAELLAMGLIGVARADGFEIFTGESLFTRTS